MAGVMIGVDPHKGSHTAVVLDAGEVVLGQVRVTARTDQLMRLQQWAQPWPDRVWAVEGARGLGRLLTQQLLTAGERVVDVQPKLAARVRLLNTGQVNKNDPNDARSVAVAALRSRQVSEASLDDHTVVLRVWARRYRDLGRLRTQVTCRLHTVLCEMVPGGFSREISAGQAIQVLAGIVADTPMTAARLELAHDLVGDLQRIDEQRREVRRRTARAVTSSATSITEIYGVGPIVAATVLGYVRDIHRFPTRDHFAAYNGTAPIEASSGNRKIYRLSRRGNRQLNYVITWPRSLRSAITAPSAGLLRPQDRRGHDRQGSTAFTQTQGQRRHLQPHDQRRRPTGAEQHRQGPGRANGERLCIQRDRLTPRITGSSEKPLPGQRQA